LSWDWAQSTGITNSKGVVTFMGLQPGAYVVTASKEGYNSATTNPQTVKPDETTFVTVPLTAIAAEFEEIKIGNNVIEYTDRAAVEREIPFFIELGNTSSEEPFMLDDQTFYYRCDDADQIVTVANGDYLNGFLIEINNDSINTDNGLEYIPTNDEVQIGGVEFDIFSYMNSTLRLTADGNCQFSTQPFSNPDFLYIDGVLPLNNTVYYDDDDPERGPTLPLEVTNDALNGAYKYRMFVEKMSNSDGDVYLLLHQQNFVTDKGKAIAFHGTDTEEGGSVNVGYYKPDTAYFGENASDGRYLIGKFAVNESRETRLITVLIETAIDDTIMLPNSELSFYTGCIYYQGELGVETLECNKTEFAETAYGSKIIVDDRIAEIEVPIR